MAFIFIDANSANPMHGVIQKDSVITYNVLWCEHPPSGCNGRGQAMGMAVHALSFAVRVANARPLPAVDWRNRPTAQAGNTDRAPAASSQRIWP